MKMFSSRDFWQAEQRTDQTNLLASLGVLLVGHVSALEYRADDGQPLPCFQLRCEGQQTRMLHRQV